MTDCQKARDLRLGEHVRAQFDALGHRPKAGDVVHVYRDDVSPWLEDEALCGGRCATPCADCAYFDQRVTQNGERTRRDVALGRFVRGDLFLANDPTLERTVVTVGQAQVADWL